MIFLWSLLFGAGPFILRDVSCRPIEQVKWRVQGDEYSQGSQSNSQRIDVTATQEKDSANKGNSYAYDSLCSDLKVTDIAIVVLTLFLVIVGWGICPVCAFPVDTLVSHLLDSESFLQWRAIYMRKPIIVQNIFRPGQRHHFRHVSIPEEENIVDTVFFGRVTYMDVFKDTHYTTFAYHRVAQNYDAIGRSLSDDFD